MLVMSVSYCGWLHRTVAFMDSWNSPLLLICTILFVLVSSCIHLMPGDVSVLLWVATPDCCIYGLFETDCLMPWILYFLLISSFPSTEASTFWHKQTIAYDGWRPDMTSMWSCCQGKSLWAWQKKSSKNLQGEYNSDWPRLIQTDPSSTSETKWGNIMNGSWKTMIQDDRSV